MFLIHFQTYSSEKQNACGNFYVFKTLSWMPLSLEPGESNVESISINGRYALLCIKGTHILIF